MAESYLVDTDSSDSQADIRILRIFGYLPTPQRSVKIRLCVPGRRQCPRGRARPDGMSPRPNRAPRKMRRRFRQLRSPRQQRLPLRTMQPCPPMASAVNALEFMRSFAKTECTPSASVRRTLLCRRESLRQTHQERQWYKATPTVESRGAFPSTQVPAVGRRRSR